MRSARSAPVILADARWTEPSTGRSSREVLGIRRFAREVFARLPSLELLSEGLPLLHPLEPLWLTAALRRRRPKAYFSPGFNPPLRSAVPFVFTIHDLIHVHFSEETDRTKQLYYALVVRPATRRAARVVTGSEFTKRELLDWAGLRDDAVAVARYGVGPEFTADGPRHEPGYPYLFYVGNRKPHKNLRRLLGAFARSRLARDVGLVLTGMPDGQTIGLARELGIGGRLKFAGALRDDDLPAYYRGAVLVVLPSLYEGFGLPAVEAMASGVPLLASNAAAVPEVVGDAGVLVDPHDVEALAEAMRELVEDERLRGEMRRRGLARAKQFSWDRTAATVRDVLEEAAGG